jgi:hypothetical protein
MRVIFLIILSLMLNGYSWAYLTAGKVAVTATSSSSGVSSTSQDSDISDSVGTSVAVGVPVAVTGNVNISGTYQVNGTPISATSNWNQSGSTINYIAGNVGIGSATPGQALDVVGTVRATSFSGPLNSPYVKVTNTQTSGTKGGDTTSGSWLVAVMNTKDNDTASIASLCTANATPVATCTAANQIVLPAGTYRVNITLPFYGGSAGNQTRLYNVTGSAILLNGTDVYIAGGAPSQIIGQFTLASTSALSVQYEVTTSQVDGQGYPSSFGTEVYLTASFEKSL